jgi:hypothetical protein
MADFKEYCDEIHDNLDYFARWFPADEPVQVGDYGTMEGDKFNPLGNLRDLGVIVGFDSDDSTNDSISYASSKDVSFNSKVGVNLPGVAGGSITVSLGKKNSIFLLAEDITYASMKNITKLGAKLDELHKANKWKTSYVFVSKRVISRRFLVAIADSDNSSFKLSGTVSKAVTGVADIRLDDLSYGSVSGSVSKFNHVDGTVKTPLFELYEWKNPWLGLGTPYVAPYK